MFSMKKWYTDWKIKGSYENGSLIIEIPNYYKDDKDREKTGLLVQLLMDELTRIGNKKA